MSEVEKMYRNAHVYPRVYGDITKETFENKVFNIADMCNEAFTAEKQLEIVKFMLHKGIYYDADGDTYWFHYTDEIENATYRPFEEALAELINSLWQDLTDTDKAQIKEILE